MRLQSYPEMEGYKGYLVPWRSKSISLTNQALKSEQGSLLRQITENRFVEGPEVTLQS